jgi:hypothetical protein
MNLEDFPAPREEKYEDWLQSKGRGQDGENSSSS